MVRNHQAKQPLYPTCMTLALFNALPLADQFATVFESGTFVVTRWHEIDDAVNLYELPGRFFVEVTYNTTRNELLDVFSFGREDWGRLEDYAVSVQLPEGLE